MEEKLLLDEMQRLVDKATSHEVVLRGLGAVAIRSHTLAFAERCPVLRRDFTDLDFLTYSKMEKTAMVALEECGYHQDNARAYIRGITGRSMLESSEKKIVVDLFFDRLSYNHKIELNGRLERDPLTIPIADLFLEKTQIVQINEKDVKDSILLIGEHPLGKTDAETLNVDRVCDVLSNDWGFYYTVTNNLTKISDYAKKVDGMSDADRDTVLSKIDQLRGAIEQAPKSFGWKMRARVGPKKKWYADVEELVAGH